MSMSSSTKIDHRLDSVKWHYKTLSDFIGNGVNSNYTTTIIVEAVYVTTIANRKITTKASIVTYVIIVLN